VWVYAGDMGSRARSAFGLTGIPSYNMQMLATRGYVVLWPDIPVHVGSPMLDLLKAVTPAVDRAIELGVADPERLGVMGQSGGGYSTLALLVQTHRFKAGVMSAGFGNLTSLYGAMHEDGTDAWTRWLEHGTGAMGAPLWEAPQRYLQNSPVFYLDKVETPLLMEAGTADVTITPYSDEVFVGLTRLHKDVTYLRYANEGHVLMSNANIADYWSRVVDFLDEHLKRRSESTTTTNSH
jgi:dipeptidyl aminopeptidase/acylaminoacyl peptidase